MSDFDKAVVERLMRELAESQAQVRALAVLLPPDKSLELQAVLDGVPEVVPRTEYERGYDTAKADLAAGLRTAATEAGAMGQTATKETLDTLATSVEATAVVDPEVVK